MKECKKSEWKANGIAQQNLIKKKKGHWVSAVEIFFPLIFHDHGNKLDAGD